MRKRGTHKVTRAPPPKKGSAMSKDDIEYLLKFAPREAYVDDLINGRLYMNAAGYYHGLPGEQGDPLEASMAPGVCLYGYACLQYGRFARLADRHVADGGSIYAHGPISYGVPGPKLIHEIFEGIPHNLVIKTPKYAYQREYRIIGTQAVECRLIPDVKHPGCKIEEYDHAELDLGSGLTGFTWKVLASNPEEARDGLMLDLPHQA